jgi:adenine phosphoribosyltransferase
MRIVVASGSPLKIDVVKSLFGDDNLIISRAVEGTVPQPIGQAQALECARARVRACVDENNDDDDDVIVAIESFVEPTYPGSTEYVDRTLVVIGADDEHYALALSFDHVLVPEYAPTPVNHTTVGACVAAHLQRPEVATDWYRAVGAPFDRATTMKSPLLTAMDRWRSTRAFMRSVPVVNDFPKPGVQFLDLFGAIANGHRVLETLKVAMKRAVTPPSREFFIAGLESRGLMLGALLAAELSVRFVAVRKPGKLPGAVESIEYAKEYGRDGLEVAVRDDLPPNVIVVDDVIATGGSMAAACELLERLPGVRVHTALSLFEVKTLRAEWRRALAGRNVRFVF